MDLRTNSGRRMLFSTETIVPLVVVSREPRENAGRGERYASFQGEQSVSRCALRGAFIASLTGLLFVRVKDHGGQRNYRNARYIVRAWSLSSDRRTQKNIPFRCNDY